MMNCVVKYSDIGYTAINNFNVAKYYLETKYYQTLGDTFILDALDVPRSLLARETVGSLARARSSADTFTAVCCWRAWREGVVWVVK